jgi:hypothetical protein
VAWQHREQEEGCRQHTRGEIKGIRFILDDAVREHMDQDRAEEKPEALHLINLFA